MTTDELADAQFEANLRTAAEAVGVDRLLRFFEHTTELSDDDHCRLAMLYVMGVEQWRGTTAEERDLLKRGSEPEDTREGWPLYRQAALSMLRRAIIQRLKAWGRPHDD